MDYKFRMYSPLLGRFISPDNITPAGPQGLNRYSYVTNNPVRFNDPTGHCPEEDSACRDRLKKTLPKPNGRDKSKDKNGGRVPIKNPTPSTPVVTGTPEIPTLTPIVPVTTSSTPSTTTVMANSTPCSTPMPGASLCSDSVTPPPGWTPSQPWQLDDDLASEVSDYIRPGDYYSFDPSDMISFSEVLEDIGHSLPAWGVPAIKGIGDWVSLKTPTIIYGVRLMNGSPIILVPKVLFTGNSNLGIPSLFPIKEYY